MMIPFEALKKLLAFAKDPSLLKVSEAMAALSEVMTWIGSVWDIFQSQPKAAFTVSGDCCDELSARLADLESQPADVKMGIPSWLLPLVLELAKKLLDKLGEK